MRIPTAQDMHALGLSLGKLLRAGDLVLLDGPLGAGKTTLTQGIAEGLGVRGPITSPTFVIARQHPSLVAGPPLMHLDAYRITTWDELEDLGIAFVAPHMQMPAVTKFVDGTGPVWAGSLFPFLFITIACGAISGKCGATMDTTSTQGFAAGLPACAAIHCSARAVMSRS